MENNNAGPKKYGFLAQELEEVLPELVFDIEMPGEVTIIEGNEDEYNEDSTSEDENGYSVPGEERELIPTEFKEAPSTTYKGVDYISLIALLTQAIQEQQDQIDILQREGAGSRNSDVGLEQMIEDTQDAYKELADDYRSLKSDFLALQAEVLKLKSCMDCDLGYIGEIEQQSIISNKEFEVYPNPANDIVQIVNKAGQTGYKVSVYNSAGQPLLTNVTQEETHFLDTAFWPAGTYLVVVSGNGEVLVQEKILIVH